MDSFLIISIHAEHKDKRVCMFPTFDDSVGAAPQGLLKINP